MTENKGVGLAATQVGLKIRMFVWKQYGVNRAIWNPTLSQTKGSMESIEGCLSLPKVSVTLQRATSCVLRGTGVDGLQFELRGTEDTTRIWQHEIDHLDGKLIIDNMNRNETISNKKALKRLRKKTVS